MGICQSLCKCFKSSNTATNTTVDNDPMEPLTSNSSQPQINLEKELLVTQNKGNLEDTYTISKQLGEGSFGSVYLGVNKLTKEQRAIKKLKKPKGYDKYKVSDEIKKEIDILKKLDHQNIMKIYEFYENDEEFALVTELCEGGELFDTILAKKYLEEVDAAIIMFQLFGAIAYCHSQNIMHRDLKTENILLETKKKNGYYKIKLIDFGIAKILEKGEFETSLSGTCFYIAPEVIQKNYDKRCDLWSCGVILYILLCGQLPFGGNDNREIFRNIQKGHYDMNLAPFPTVSNEAKNLIDKLLQQDPNRRISAEDALQHPWFIKWKIKEKMSVLKSKQIKAMIKNIREYKSNHILQQAALAYIVHNLPNIEVVQNACRLFIKIDKNLDGSISREEFVEGLNELIDEENEKFDEQELDNIFDIIDSDKSNSIEYEEFIRAAADKKALLDKKYLQDAFNFFDKDKSGSIDLSEIQKVFFEGKETNQDELRAIIQEVDLNNDGTIDFKEFSIMMKKILV